jgi:hypothetical protein
MILVQISIEMISCEFVEDAQNGNYCKPAGVSIKCNFREMEIEFTADHLYGNLDEDHYGKTTSEAYMNDAGCSAISDANGNYKMTFKLDKCGTTLTQEDGKLVFANRVEPNKAAATTSGIIMTMPLGTDVRCNYEDNFDLTIDDLYIDDDVIDTGDEDGVIDGEGDFSNYFSISAYSQSDYTDDITEQNRISIGAPVYLEIKENKAIPNNLEFFLKDCTGYTDIDHPTTYADSSFQFVQDMCYADLVSSTSLAPFQGGQDDGYLRMNFRAFSFAAENSDTVDIRCTVQICALDVKGKKLDKKCANNRQCPAGYHGACEEPDCTKLE